MITAVNTEGRLLEPLFGLSVLDRRRPSLSVDIKGSFYDLKKTQLFLFLGDYKLMKTC